MSSDTPTPELPGAAGTPSRQPPGTSAKLTVVGGSDYAQHPLSIGEIKANRGEDASLWSPRDALISVLREIDEGANCDAVTIAWRTVDANGKAATRWAVSGPDAATSVGIMRLAEMKMLRELMS